MHGGPHSGQPEVTLAPPSTETAPMQALANVAVTPAATATAEGDAWVPDRKYWELDNEVRRKGA
jgi:hypothetical protein